MDSTAARREPAPEAAPLLRVLLVGAAGRRLGLPLDGVREVVPMVSATPVAETPPWLLGVFNRRGVLIPLIDVSLRIDGAPTPLARASRVVIVGDRDSASSEHALGLLVEDVAELASLDTTAPPAHPGFESGGEHLGPVASYDGVLVQVVRLDHLLDDEDRRTLFGRFEAGGAS